jgi:hypothetical protein
MKVHGTEVITYVNVEWFCFTIGRNINSIAVLMYNVTMHSLFISQLHIDSHEHHSHQEHKHEEDFFADCEKMEIPQPNDKKNNNLLNQAEVILKLCHVIIFMNFLLICLLKVKLL